MSALLAALLLPASAWGGGAANPLVERLQAVERESEPLSAEVARIAAAFETLSGEYEDAADLSALAARRGELQKESARVYAQVEGNYQEYKRLSDMLLAELALGQVADPGAGIGRETAGGDLPVLLRTRDVAVRLREWRGHLTTAASRDQALFQAAEESARRRSRMRWLWAGLAAALIALAWLASLIRRRSRA